VEVRPVGISKGLPWSAFLGEIAHQKPIATPFDFVFVLGHFLSERYTAGQCSAVHYRALQYRTAQYSAVQDRTVEAHRHTLRTSSSCSATSCPRYTTG